MPELIPLNYAAAKPKWRKRAARSCLALILLSIAFGTWRWGPYLWHQSQILYQQRQCMNFAASANTVVYEEDPAAAATLLKASEHSPYVLKRGYGPKNAGRPVQAAAFDPSCWHTLRTIAALPRDSVSYQSPIAAEAVLFLHERTTPAGHRRLVCVNYAPDTDTFQPEFIPGYNYDANVATPATWTKPIVVAQHGYVLNVMSGWPRRSPLVRVYAGQADPNDPSHFTIRYQIWGQEDVVDGYLKDDDSVLLTPRKLPDWPNN